jgi:hypothetical protein
MQNTPLTIIILYDDNLNVSSSVRSGLASSKLPGFFQDTNQLYTKIRKVLKEIGLEKYPQILDSDFIKAN